MKGEFWVFKNLSAHQTKPVEAAPWYQAAYMEPLSVYVTNPVRFLMHAILARKHIWSGQINYSTSATMSRAHHWYHVNNAIIIRLRLCSFVKGPHSARSSWERNGTIPKDGCETGGETE
jgi:hypothetical protein